MCLTSYYVVIARWRCGGGWVEWAAGAASVRLIAAHVPGPGREPVIARWR